MAVSARDKKALLTLLEQAQLLYLFTRLPKKQVLDDPKVVRIFDRYAGAQSPTTRVLQGTGLGLPIVRQIVQLHQGTVWATSESGEGSVFHVRLPLPNSVTPPRAT